MILEELLKEHRRITQDAEDLLAEKVINYSGHHGDVFTNFNRVEQLGICSVEQGLMARIADKMGRLITHVKDGGLVGSEGFDDSILDLINYLIFLHCAVRRGKWEEKADG
jgi:hypothetical protein